MDNSFVELIKDIKKDDSINNLEKNYQKCVRYLKDLDKRKSNDKLFLMNSVVKEKSLVLLKLLYLQMFGRKIDKEHNFSVIQLLTCNKYFLKRRGFFFLNSISDNDDIIFLSINLFKKELYKDSISSIEQNVKSTVLSSLSNMGTKIIKENINIFNNMNTNNTINTINTINTNNMNSMNSINSFHANNSVEPSYDKNKKNNFTGLLQDINTYNGHKVFNTFLILNSISNICTDMMSSNLYNDIFFLLNNSNVYIRKKTILCFYKLVISNLSILHTFFDLLKKNFISLYNNENTSYEKLPSDKVDYTFRNNTCLCCLIINVLAEIFSYLERRQMKYNNSPIRNNQYRERDLNLVGTNKKKNDEQVCVNNKSDYCDNTNYYNSMLKNNEKISHEVAAQKGEEISFENDNINNNNNNNNNDTYVYTYGDTCCNNNFYNDEHDISNYLKKFLSFVPFIYNILNERLSIIDNWKLIKFIKFINKLVRYEYRIYKKFLPIIIHIFFTNKAKSVIFECYDFILFNYKKNYNVHIPNVDSYINTSVLSQQISGMFTHVGTSNGMKNVEEVRHNDKNNHNDHSVNHSNVDGNIQRTSSYNKHNSNNPENVVLSQEHINTYNIIHKEENNTKENNTVGTPFDKFLFYCFKQLLSSFFTEDTNIMYMTINLYKYLFIIPDIYEYFTRYNLLNEFSRNILKNFYHKDITIRKKLLYILYFLLNEKNFEQIVYSILIYLYNHHNNCYNNAESKPFDYADEYINVIINYCINNLNNVQNVNVYIFILFYLLCLKNHTKEYNILEHIHKINTKLKITHITTNFLSCIFIITYALGFIKDTLERNHLYVKNNKLKMNKLEMNKCIQKDHHNIKHKNMDTNDNIKINEHVCFNTNRYNASYNNIQVGNVFTNVMCCPSLKFNKNKENLINKLDNQDDSYFLDIISHYEEIYEYILINDIFNLKKEIKNFNILNKYDVFEYIIIILKLYDKIYPDAEYIECVRETLQNDDPLNVKREMKENYEHVKEKYDDKKIEMDKGGDNNNYNGIDNYNGSHNYGDNFSDNHIRTCEYLKCNKLDHIKVESFEYIIYFITIYLEETYDKIKEFKDMFFLKLFFFTLYLFFISYNSANILWNVIKIFMFFLQFEENHSLLLFYFYRCYTHLHYLIKKKNDVYNLDTCILLKNILSLLLNTKKENYKTFNFYHYFNNTINIQENDNKHLNLNQPFKYDDSFFFFNNIILPKEQSGTTNKKNNKPIKNIKDDMDNNTYHIHSMKKQTKNNIHTSITNELDILINKHKQYKEKWINIFPFYIIYQNDHFKLYLKHQTDNKQLILYIHLKNDTFILNNFNLYTSFNLINYNILHKYNTDYTNFNDDVQNYFYKYNITIQKKMDTYNHPINNKNFIQIENITRSIFLCIKYDTYISDMKLCYDYFFNTQNGQNKGLLIIPYVKMDPLHLSTEDFKRVNSKNVMLRNMNYEITTEKNSNIYKLLFNYFLFLSQYLNISFFNMNNIFVNLKNEVQMNELRIIFCICESTKKSLSTLEDNIILLLNVKPQKKEESNMSYIYNIYLKMKILNNSQDDSNKLLDYFEFYIKQLFLQKIINIDFSF
ncbi:AP-3 complex subunit delta, putative [Plasmodium reichenowi]|uniref:AP-3 complex subunit delta, putative n=1 Tax=Plasmodium reichenowi TaxID=5854 RepID=A0A060RRE8_PLARE|nr:AP-3 complex subunit delta, putative [Plasmodium reichenowi]